MKKLVTETKPTMHDIAAVLTFKYGSETRKSEKKKKHAQTVETERTRVMRGL